MVNAMAVIDRDRQTADDFRCAGTVLRTMEAAEYMAIRAEVSQAHAALVELIDAARYALKVDDAGAMSDTARFNLEAALADIDGVHP